MKLTPAMKEAYKKCWKGEITIKEYKNLINSLSSLYVRDKDFIK